MKRKLRAIDLTLDEVVAKRVDAIVPFTRYLSDARLLGDLEARQGKYRYQENNKATSSIMRQLSDRPALRDIVIEWFSYRRSLPLVFPRVCDFYACVLVWAGLYRSWYDVKCLIDAGVDPDSLCYGFRDRVIRGDGRRWNLVKSDRSETALQRLLENDHLVAAGGLALQGSSITKVVGMKDYIDKYQRGEDIPGWKYPVVDLYVIKARCLIRTVLESSMLSNGGPSFTKAFSSSVGCFLFE